MSREQLWSWVDREAPELEEHLSECPLCRERSAEIRSEIDLIAAGAVPAEIPVPDRIGDYEVRRLIGEGGQALVYEAEQPELRRRVALKVLKGGRFAGKNRLRRFVRETQTLARLKHPAIATIFETGHTREGQHYFAMELVDGVPLDEYVRSSGLPRAGILRLLAKICDAVQYAHRHGVVHRDLKPSNILVDAEGAPHILDFGLARITRPDLPLASLATAPGVIEGTPRYMSPEQACGEPDRIDARTDVYSLGVIGYELLTGVPPYDIGRITQDSIRTICESMPQPPASLRRDLRGDLDTILLKTLEKDPALRYQTADELGADLRRHLDDEPIRARAAGPLGMLGRRLRGRRWRVAVALVAAAALLLGSIRLIGSSRDADRTRREVLNLQCDLFADGRDGHAMQRLEINWSRYRSLPEAQLVRAHGLMLFREVRIAVSMLEDAVAADPTRWDFRLLLGEILGDPDMMCTAERDVPQTVDGQYLSVFATADPCTALSRAERVLGLDPGHPLALVAAARLGDLTGNPPLSLEAANALIAAGRESAFWTNFKGGLLLRAGRFEDALTVFDELVAADPTGAKSITTRAFVHRQMRNYPEAIEDLDEAVERLGGGRPAAWIYYHRATPHWIMGHREEAARDYAVASRLLTHPTFGDARRYFVLHELGRPDEASEMLAAARAGLRDDPWLARVLDCLAGDLAPAALVDEDVATPVQRCEGYYYAGETSLLAGDPAAAASWFRRCLETGLRYDPASPNDSMSEYELAEWRLSPARSEIIRPEPGPERFPGGRCESSP